MTGIERLRKLADKYAEMGKDHTTIDVVPSGMAMLLADIADQIGRERACDSDTIENIRLIVGRVIDDMERHVLGHEGMEDSPVARWARDLREALGGDERDHADERDAIAWVREHGGLETVEARLMPEGCEWPTVDGKPVDFVTGYEPSLGVLEAVSIYSNGACEVMGHDGIIKGVNEIHVATPKVLDADGVEIRVGDTVYYVDGREQMVNTVARLTDGLVQFGRINEAGHVTYCEGACISPNQLTHERPESKCRDCAHWQKDPTADNRGVCWFLYHEHEGQDCYAARLGECGACEEFVRRAKKLAGVSE